MAVKCLMFRIKIVYAHVSKLKKKTLKSVYLEMLSFIDLLKNE